MKRRSSWSAMWCRAVISSWESAGWVNSYRNIDGYLRASKGTKRCCNSRTKCQMFTLHCMKGLSRTKMGIRVRTMKSMKSQKAKPPTFLRAISFTCRLKRYHWFPNERSKQTNTTFRATRRERMSRSRRRREP